MTGELSLCGNRAALEMHELELGYMVVVHAQRDPGEYMHELRAWARLPQGPLRRWPPLVIPIGSVLV